jgi:GR25 family glycosyltransferase involved in LPS biosynthesis
MLGLLSRKKKSNEIITTTENKLLRDGIKNPNQNFFLKKFNFGIDKFNLNILPEKKSWLNQLNVEQIFIINLENQPEKLLLMKYKLSKIGIIDKIKIIPAINGYESRKCQEYLEKIKKNPKNKIYSLGAIGLLETYKQFIINFPIKNRILILEDDVCFHNNFINLIENYKNLENYDIIYLGYNIPKWEEELNSQRLIYDKLDFTSFKKYVYGTYGYILNEKVLELLKIELEDSEILLPIDVILNKLKDTYQLNVIAINPALIIPIVSSSINMGKRNQISFLNNIKQDYRNYQFLELSQNFTKIFIDYFSYQLNLRGNHNLLSYDINNLELAKIIENKNKFFCIIITSYNNEEWVKINLESVKNQTYPHWRIIYYNDNSEDNTLNMLQNYIKEYSLENKIKVIDCNIRNYQAYGRWISYQECDDDEICVFLDGDDWFFDDKVLEKLNKLYLEKDYWVTYGGYHVYFKNNLQKIITREFPVEIVKNKSYRSYQWISFHLRTGLAKLFKSIPLSYLTDKNGEYIKCVTDWAEMFWVLERCNGKHGINNFDSYIYNKDASIMNDNSFYNRDKDIAWKIYRQELEDKYRNFKI